MRDIGKKIGKVEEVEMDETGECFGSFFSPKNLDRCNTITEKRLLLKLEDSERIFIESLMKNCLTFASIVG